VGPYGHPPELTVVNPLSKVPALLLDDGSALYDSRVICEYLDALGPDSPFMPSNGPARWTSLRRIALADGLMDTTLSILLENGRPEAERSAKTKARWIDSIRTTLDALEIEIGEFGATIGLEHIGLGCALEFLDRPTAEHPNWRALRPMLAAWFAMFDQRPSMQATRP
jgi:glutathione S-transferase